VQRRRFGSDHSDRGHLVRIAGERARATFPAVRIAWHVGDTPADVQAAAFGGARALGVCTGVFAAEDLRAANSEAVVRADLAEVQSVLALLLAGTA
jgi:phosphoglycolate phosphatase-like HAD superfamily hydrolase